MFIITICLFLFLTGKYYFSDINKKNLYRSLNNINQKIRAFVYKLPVLKDDTKDIIEYTKLLNNKKKKRYSFWELLEINEKP